MTLYSYVEFKNLVESLIPYIKDIALVLGYIISALITIKKNKGTADEVVSDTKASNEALITEYINSAQEMKDKFDTLYTDILTELNTIKEGYNEMKTNQDELLKENLELKKKLNELCPSKVRDANVSK